MSVPLQCQIAGCNRKAAGAIALRIPALLCPIPEHDPVKVITSIFVCSDCFREGAPELELLSPAMRRLVREETLGKGLAAPDFERTYTELVPLSDPELAVLLKSMEGRPGEEE